MSKFKFVGSFIAFLVLASVSCIATEKSLSMVLPNFGGPVVIWAITIVFFAVASIGTYLITSSLMGGYVRNRTPKLIGGILLVICFWLLMSMPTNTHTFFYRDEIGPTVIRDIATTNEYLQQIIEKGSSKVKVYDAAGKKIKDQVEEQRRHIVAQFNGDEPPYRRGNGKLIGTHLEKINNLLGSSIKQNINYNSTDPAILNQYQMEIDQALEHALASHTISATSLSDAVKAKERLDIFNNAIQDQLATKTLQEDVINQCETELGKGYEIISLNRRFVNFNKGTDDKEIYTQNKLQTRTARLSSVMDVFFVDFLGGKYDGRFWYYVVLSILVDIAAFIFFDIAFTKREQD